MSIETIPQRATDISPDWLSGVLDVGPVADVHAENLGEGLGLLGEVSRLRITYAPGVDGPTTLIAKCQSPAAENAFVAQLMGFYRREVCFYTDAAAAVAVNVPRCYHAAITDEGAPFVLLLEEVTDARTIDQIAGAGRADTETVIDQAVALHASLWDNEALWRLDWLPPMNTPLNLAAGELARQKLPAYLDHWKDQAPGDVLDFVVALTPHYPALLDWWVEQGHPTYVHTDFRADNLLFGGSAGDAVVTILDWQFSTRGVGVWDVANFLTGSLTVEHRREWETELVRRYHEGLLAAGVDGYDWDRCWRDYRFAIGQQVWSTLPMGDLDSGNERGQQLLATLTPRYLSAADDLGVAEMLELF